MVCAIKYKGSGSLNIVDACNDLRLPVVLISYHASHINNGVQSQKSEKKNPDLTKIDVFYQQLVPFPYFLTNMCSSSNTTLFCIPSPSILSIAS